MLTDSLQSCESVIDDVEMILDEAFGPALRKIELEKQLIREHYRSRLAAGKFAVGKNLNVDQLLWLLKKYGLPRRIKTDV